MEAAKEDVEQQASIEVEIAGANFEILQAAKELEKLIREEPLKRLEAYSVREQVDVARGNYQIELANGQRTISEMIQFRKNSAADIQTLPLPRHGVPHLPQRRVAEVPGAVRPRGALRLSGGDRLRLRDQPAGLGQRRRAGSS